MKVAIYVRVSTDMQADDGFSIDGQITRLTSFAESQDWEIYDTYIDDGYSAKDLHRPAMQQLMGDMENRLFDIVLVYKLDRLTRSVADLHALLKTFDLHGVKFKSATEIFETTTAMGRFFITLVGAMAEWERGTISERVRFGVEQMVREGKRPGGVLPYGYTQEGELIPEEASIIRKVKDMYLSGLGFKSIAMKLNAQGLLRRGSEWTSATAAYTLENPYYAGIIRLGSKTPTGGYVNTRRDDRVNCIYGEGSHEAIFTKEEYEEIKKFMERKSHGGFSQIKTYWFSGVLRCGRCGSAMFGRLSHGRMRKDGVTPRYQYYICSTKHHNGSCDMPIFQQRHVEHLMMEYIQRIKYDNQRINEESLNLTIDEKQQENEINLLKRSLGKINERKEKWKYMFVEDLISKDEFRKQIQLEEDEEMNIKQEIALAESSLSGIPKVNHLVELEDVWHKLNDDEKKQFVLTIFKRISVNTDLTKVKGVKNRFFDAYISEVEYN